MGILSFVSDLGYIKLISVMIHGNFVFFLRCIHMLGSNFALLILILHVMKSVSGYSVVTGEKLFVWITGTTIFLLGLGAAFTGYVLVAGNMSF